MFDQIAFFAFESDHFIVPILQKCNAAERCIGVVIGSKVVKQTLFAESVAFFDLFADFVEFSNLFRIFGNTV